MKAKVVIAVTVIAGALVLWNYREFSSLQPDTGRIAPVGDMPVSVDYPRFDWNWCDEVDVEVVEAVCRIKSLPPELEALEGKKVVVAGPSFACGEDLVQREDGYTIKGFILVPYFGMIDCCIGNPIPYFQWTVVVKQLRTPWEINHRGIVNPNVVVCGTLRIKREQAYDGIFFLEDAEVIHSAEQEKELQRVQNL